MYTVTKSFHFAAAHRLMYYEGPCRFVHGHNFVVTMTLSAEQPADVANGFVYDFKQLTTFKQFVEEKYDHAFITQLGDEIGEYLCAKGHKFVFLDLAPSTEHLAKQLYDEFNECISLPDGVLLVSIHIQETPTAAAAYEA